jgi:hypothetical protein
MVMILTGCATKHEGVSDKKDGSEGISKVYPVSADQAWEIGKVVFHWEGRNAIEEHRDQGYMLTSSGIGPVAWGTVMGAWFVPVDGENTKVTVITRRRVPVNIAGPMLNEESFQRRFAQAVEIVKKGEPLPAKAPD